MKDVKEKGKVPGLEWESEGSADEEIEKVNQAPISQLLEESPQTKAVSARKGKKAGSSRPLTKSPHMRSRSSGPAVTSNSSSKKKFSMSPTEPLENDGTKLRYGPVVVEEDKEDLTIFNDSYRDKSKDKELAHHADFKRLTGNFSRSDPLFESANRPAKLPIQNNCEKERDVTFNSVLTASFASQGAFSDS